METGSIFSGIRTPTVYFVDSKQNAVHMEYLDNVETVNIHVGKLLKVCTMCILCRCYDN